MELTPFDKKMAINTDAIDSNGFFDPRYTCDFDNSSPELRWSNAPAESMGFVLIAEDPDAHKGLFTHWLVYGIPAHVHHLPAGIPAQETLPNGIRQGVNSFGKLGYGGPCPPSGDHAHRYIFRIYALSIMPEFQTRASRDQILETIHPHIMATAELTGLYQRSIQKTG